MKLKESNLSSFLVAAGLCLGFVGSGLRICLANDSAASTAVGGIILKREPRISMEKEQLSISLEKVSVEYEFLNETDRDITTEVAFPIPPYKYVFSDTGGPRTFDDFHLWVGGEPVKYSTQAKALLNGKDFAPLLGRLNIDSQDFGHFDYDDEKLLKYDVAKLAKDDKRELVHLGLVAAHDLKPQWTLEKTYHWTQLFPAHQIARVRHEYSPAWGWSDMFLANLDGDKSIQESCMDPSLRATVIKDSKRNDGSADSFALFWVDYILTTANSWKTPIKDFELVVERPSAALSEKMHIAASKWYVSFCWTGKIDLIDENHFAARTVNFVPTKELHVAFFGTNSKSESR